MKRRMLLLTLCCWVTYLTAYLCRVNFSSAMDTLSVERALTLDQLGLVGAVFYGVYACGQLVNGYLGDRVRSNRFIMLALLGTCLCNVGLSMARTLPLILLCWGINGIFQSMFWSTIIRILAQNCPADKRAGMSSIISTAMPAAYLVSWSLLGQCFDGLAAQWYFLVPACVAIVMIGVWLLLSRKLSNAIEPPRSKATLMETFAFLKKENLHILLLVCLFHGLIKEGVAYWLPLLVHDLPGAGTVPPYLLIAVLPVANFTGIMLTKLLLRRGPARPLGIIAGLTGSIALVSAGVILGQSLLLIVGFMALISGLCYCNNTILLSYLPMQYTGQQMVASIIGVFDFASYVGAALSTYVLGKLLASAGFAPLPYVWLAAALAALGIVLGLRRRIGKEKRS